MGNIRFARLQAEAQNWKCFYCEGEMWSPSWETREAACTRLGITMKQLLDRTATREHLKKAEHGGQRTRDNIIAACHYCNTKRGGGDFSVEEHKTYMMKMAAEGRHPTAINENRD